MFDTPCQEWRCTKLAKPLDTASFKGVGREGQDIVVWYQRWECEQGHRYMTEILEEDV